MLDCVRRGCPTDETILTLQQKSRSSSCMRLKNSILVPLLSQCYYTLTLNVLIIGKRTRLFIVLVHYYSCHSGSACIHCTHDTIGTQPNYSSPIRLQPLDVHVHENSVGLSSTTNPNLRGKPSHCLLRQT